MSKPSIRAIRAALRAEFGQRKYRITHDGSIHVYGQMPGADLIGWYLFGWIGDTPTEQRLGLVA